MVLIIPVQLIVVQIHFGYFEKIARARYFACLYPCLKWQEDTVGRSVSLLLPVQSSKFVHRLLRRAHQNAYSFASEPLCCTNQQHILPDEMVQSPTIHPVSLTIHRLPKCQDETYLYFKRNYDLCNTSTYTHINVIKALVVAIDSFISSGAKPETAPRKHLSQKFETLRNSKNIRK